MSDSVVLIQTAFIGDFVLTTPVISALNRVFGRNRVYVVARPFAKDLIRNTLISFDKRKINKYSELIRVVLEVRALKPSVVLTPHLSASSAIISFLSGARERIGFEENSLHFLFTKRIRKFESGIRKESERLARILQPLGIEPGNPEIHVDTTLVERWSRYMELHGARASQKKVVFAPFSNWETKSYVFWKELLRMVPTDFTFIVLGDRRHSAESGLEEKENVINLVGRTTLKDVVAIVHMCDLFLGVDNGISHIASALLKDCFVIFGPTVPDFGFFPNFSRFEVIQVDLLCRPCSPHGPSSCPKKHFMCMRMIRPEMVLQRFRDFAERTRI